MAETLFNVHSLTRYLVLLAAVGAIVLSAAGWRRPGLPPRAERSLGAAFIGLLDLQVVLGVILLTQWPFYGQLMGHIVMMVLAAAAAHITSIMARRKPSEAAGSGVRAIGFLVTLVLIVGGIMALLSKDFLKLVGLAFVVAAPVAYFAMSKWLDDFAYRIEINGWTFVLAGTAALFIAMLTVSFQTIKAALVNPVDTLRNE